MSVSMLRVPQPWGRAVLVVLEVPFIRMTGEADAELASNSGEASLGEGAASAAPDAAEPPQPQPQKGWPSKRLPRDTRYFVMKSFSMRDILISLKKGIWATQSRNEAKLNTAYSVRARCRLATLRVSMPALEPSSAPRSPRRAAMQRGARGVRSHALTNARLQWPHRFWCVGPPSGRAFGPCPLAVRDRWCRAPAARHGLSRSARARFAPIFLAHILMVLSL